MQPSKLKELYQQVYDQVYPQIKDQKLGVLATVIHVILDSDQTQAEKIRQEWGIEGNSSWEEDLSIVSNVIGYNLIRSKKMEQFIIILIASAIVGVPACLKYIQDTKQKSDSNSKTPPPPPPKKSECASLYLVVPASVARKFTEGKPINQAEVEELIDNASYLLCTNMCTNEQKADRVQEKLVLTEDKITDISEQREVYIKINIADGQDMIGKQIPYALKSNLPAHGQGVIRKIACIEYLSVSGLEEFNRI
ncbi:hypothetical protein [Anabaenopsis elenkinii]|uniref:Uncharacterized protein n=1 Tax=Anabaenopsis elenkinii CCIBt3563 TaxID=2779889 RepID=A0A7U3NLS2_9CYAN|nr:hypothetical protein [Anabaenopsis elenkinii]QOV21225.1 hypothetical protein IM676_10545 [Anabaenopsis elenkinii CCIBt3563]